MALCPKEPLQILIYVVPHYFPLNRHTMYDITRTVDLLTTPRTFREDDTSDNECAQAHADRDMVSGKLSNPTVLTCEVSTAYEMKEFNLQAKEFY